MVNHRDSAKFSSEETMLAIIDELISCKVRHELLLTKCGLYLDMTRMKLVYRQLAGSTLATFFCIGIMTDDSTGWADTTFERKVDNVELSCLPDLAFRSSGR